jgi:hypothetical protein
MAIKSVSALVLDGLAVFEFGVICEVFGIDRSADGVPNFDFKVCGPEAGKPLRTSVGATIIPDHGLDDLVGADLVAIPAIGGTDYLPVRPGSSTAGRARRTGCTPTTWPSSTRPRESTATCCSSTTGT